MTETRENSFDGYVSAADGGRGMFGPGKSRRCKNCEKFKKRESYIDFICRHMRGYKEAPAHVRRCYSCNMWKKSDGIPGNFWCKHNKLYKEEWDRKQGWK